MSEYQLDLAELRYLEAARRFDTYYVIGGLAFADAFDIPTAIAAFERVFDAHQALRCRIATARNGELSMVDDVAFDNIAIDEDVERCRLSDPGGYRMHEPFDHGKALWRVYLGRNCLAPRG